MLLGDMNAVPPEGAAAVEASAAAWEKATGGGGSEGGGSGKGGKTAAVRPPKSSPDAFFQATLRRKFLKPPGSGPGGGPKVGLGAVKALRAVAHDLCLAAPGGSTAGAGAAERCGPTVPTELGEGIVATGKASGPNGTTATTVTTFGWASPTPAPTPPFTRAPPPPPTHTHTLNKVSPSRACFMYLPGFRCALTTRWRPLGCCAGRAAFQPRPCVTPSLRRSRTTILLRCRRKRASSMQPSRAQWCRYWLVKLEKR